MGCCHSGEATQDSQAAHSRQNTTSTTQLRSPQQVAEGSSHKSGTCHFERRSTYSAELADDPYMSTAMCDDPACPAKSSGAVVPGTHPPACSGSGSGSGSAYGSRSITLKDGQQQQLPPPSLDALSLTLNDGIEATIATAASCLQQLKGCGMGMAGPLVSTHPDPYNRLSHITEGSREGDRDLGGLERPASPSPGTTSKGRDGSSGGISLRFPSVNEGGAVEEEARDGL